jgi:hypothetical protein
MMQKARKGDLQVGESHTMHRESGEKARQTTEAKSKKKKIQRKGKTPRRLVT